MTKVNIFGLPTLSPLLAFCELPLCLFLRYLILIHQRNPLTEKMLIDIPRLAVRWRHCWQLSPGHFWSEKLPYPCLMTYFWPVPRIIFVFVDLPIKPENCLRNIRKWPLIIDFSSHVKQVFAGCFVYILWIWIWMAIWSTF